MPSINKIAPHDQTRQFSVKFKDDASGEVEFVNLEYYKNKFTLAPMEAKLSDEEKEDLTEDQIEAARHASALCTYVKSWNLEGPLYNYRGEIIVGEGEVVPLEPLITMYLPSTITGEIIKQLANEVYPDTGKSKSGRRPSR